MMKRSGGQRTRHNRSTRTGKTTRVLASSLGAFAIGSTTLRAADVHWNVPDGDWAVDANWVWDNAGTPTNTAPTATDRALLDFTNGVTHVTTDVTDVRSVAVKNGSTLSIEAGGDVHTLAGSESATPPNPVNTDPLWAFRIGDGNVGTVNVTDGTLAHTFNTTGGGNLSADILVGVSGGNGTLAQSGTLSKVSGRDLRVGVGAGSTGTFSLSGGTTSTNGTFIGRDGGTGTIIVSAGTLADTFSTGSEFMVGYVGGSTGTATLSGGLIQASAQAAVGWVGSGTTGGDSNGTMNHTGGTLSTNKELIIGRNGSNTGTNRGIGTYTLGTDANSTAVIDVNFTTGGTTNGFLVIGRDGGKGDMTINGGTVTTDAGFLVSYNDSTSATAVNRSDGNLTMNAGTVTAGGLFAVGYGPASGTMTMSGGTLTAAGNGLGGGVGFDDRTQATRTSLASGTLVQHGGTINVAGNFAVAAASGTGSYTLDGSAALNVIASTVGTLPTVGEFIIGGTDSVTLAHTSGGTVTMAGNAKITAASILRMGQSSGKGTLTMNGGTLAIGTGTSLIGSSGAGGTGTFTLNSGALATFAGNVTVGDGQQANGSLTVSGGTLNVTGALNAGRVTTVAGVITLSAGVVNTGSIGVKTGANGTVAACDFNLSGATLTTGTITNNGTFDFTAGTANVSGSVDGTGTLTVAGGLTLEANHVIQGAASISGLVRARPNGGNTGTSKVTTLTVNSGGKLDVTNNKLIVSNPVGTWDGTAYTDTAGLLDKGYGSGTWNGTQGIITSQTDATVAHTTSLGVGTGAQVKGLSGTTTALFGGQTVAATSTLVMYTYAGDANLNGKIDGDDYFAIDSHVGVTGGGWANGDFNYDGKVNGDDYFFIDSNAGNGLGSFPTSGGIAEAASGITAVPEPAAVASLAILAARGLASRRRRNVNATS